MVQTLKRRQPEVGQSTDVHVLDEKDLEQQRGEPNPMQFRPSRKDGLSNDARHNRVHGEWQPDPEHRQFRCSSVDFDNTIQAESTTGCNSDPDILPMLMPKATENLHRLLIVNRVALQAACNI